MSTESTPIGRLLKYISDYETAPSWGGPTMYPPPPDIADIAELLRMVRPKQPPTEEPEPPEDLDDFKEWRCFHCDFVATNRAEAAEHFGSGNYEREMPICIEAATTPLKDLVFTNRQMFFLIQKMEGELEQAEHERDCWEQAARKALNLPNATWHDFTNLRQDAYDRVYAAEARLEAVRKILYSERFMSPFKIGSIRALVQQPYEVSVPDLSPEADAKLKKEFRL